MTGASPALMTTVAPPGAAVFLDRDGTLNVERHYLSRAEEFQLLPGVGPALQRLRGAGFRLFLVTNQSGIGRGYFTHADLERIHDRMRELLGQLGVEFERIYVAPEAPDQPSRYRKPSPQALLDARDGLLFRLRLDLDPRRIAKAARHVADKVAVRHVGKPRAPVRDVCQLPAWIDPRRCCRTQRPSDIGPIVAVEARVNHVVMRVKHHRHTARQTGLQDLIGAVRALIIFQRQTRTHRKRQPRDLGNQPIQRNPGVLRFIHIQSIMIGIFLDK